MAVIAVIAFLVGYFISGKRVDNKKLEKELKASQEELEKYRNDVTNHFQLTAQKVNALTENCRNVYDHLAQGAQQLCNQDDTPKLMNDMNTNKMVIDEVVATSDVVTEEATADIDSDLSTGLETNNANAENSTNRDKKS